MTLCIFSKWKFPDPSIPRSSRFSSPVAFHNGNQLFPDRCETSRRRESPFLCSQKTLCVLLDSFLSCPFAVPSGAHVALAIIFSPGNGAIHLARFICHEWNSNTSPIKAISNCFWFHGDGAEEGGGGGGGGGGGWWFRETFLARCIEQHRLSLRQQQRAFEMALLSLCRLEISQLHLPRSREAGESEPSGTQS